MSEHTGITLMCS